MAVVAVAVVVDVKEEGWHGTGDQQDQHDVSIVRVFVVRGGWSGSVHPSDDARTAMEDVGARVCDEADEYGEKWDEVRLWNGCMICMECLRWIGDKGEITLRMPTRSTQSETQRECTACVRDFLHIATPPTHRQPNSTLGMVRG